ncbi:MAG: hypothetical protein H3C41_01615 [Bacteroidales bacterium]|nr:hypothetical protein [Bacteroidales bacterium]
MKTIANLFFRLCLVCLTASLVFSCSAGRKFARQYAASADSLSVMVLFPPNVFVVNKKQDFTQESFYFAEAMNDTSLFHNSVLLPLLSDEQLIAPFRTAYLTELSNYGFRVYDADKMEMFSSLTSPSLQVNVAQIEVQEYETEYEDAISVGSDVYTKQIYLTGFNLGAWFELSPINQTNAQHFPVLFATNDITDRWNGYFTQRFLTGEIQYKLIIDSLKVADVQQFVAYLGRLYAAYTFDYLMNARINQQLPEEERGIHYYRYDPYEKRVFTIETDRFTEL